jgi:ATP-dependent Clp protease ATP-binding subunit ClpC
MSEYKLTDKMHAILAAAAGEAQALNHEYIGTEHLLLALLAARESCAATALRNLGVDLAKAANRLLSVVQRGRSYDSPNSGALLPLTSRAKKVLELAAEQAGALNHSYVGTEHLLLGLLAEGKGVAANVLFESGVGLASVRAEVLRILGVELDQAGHEMREVPPNEPPSRVAIVLEYKNGAVLSRHFTTTRDAIAFLQAK